MSGFGLAGGKVAGGALPRGVGRGGMDLRQMGSRQRGDVGAAFVQQPEGFGLLFGGQAVQEFGGAHGMDFGRQRLTEQGMQRGGNAVRGAAEGLQQASGVVGFCQRAG